MAKNIFTSGKEFCALCKNEYDSERNRTSVIDSKTNIVISFTAVFFVAVVQAINLAKIFSIEINATQTISALILPFVALISIIGALTISLLSIFTFVRVIRTHTYNIIDPVAFYDADILRSNPNEFSIVLAQKYIEATQANYFVNNKRTRLYHRGLVLLVIAIVLFALYMCLISFI